MNKSILENFNVKDEIKQTFSKKIYNISEKISNHKKSNIFLCLFSFIESFISPIPPDIFMISIMKNRPNKCFFIAFITSISSVLGGIVGYAIGYFLFQTLGSFIIELYGLSHSFEKIKDTFQNYGFWIIILKGLTPIPFKLITISSGIMNFDIFQFITASIISRFSRFYLISTLFFIFREKVIRFVDKYTNIFIYIMILIVLISIAISFI